jgi:hypothetical protein
LRDLAPLDILSALDPLRLNSGGFLNRIFALFLATVLLVALAPSLAVAQDWRSAMPADAVQSYMPADAKRVIIVPAGDHSDDAADVADAMVSAIDSREGTTAVIVDGIAAGADDDEAILERASSLAADVVLVVRVFKAENSGASTAVGTIYVDGDDAFSAFAVEAGEALEARRSPTDERAASKDEPADTSEDPADEREPAEQDAQDPSEGVSPGASAAVESVQTDNEKSIETRLTALESRVLFVSEFRIHGSDGSTESRLTFYRGVHRQEISPEAFFEELDRPELAVQYRKAKTLRTTVAIASVTGLLGGAVLLTYGATRYGDCSGAAISCEEQRARSNIVMLSGGSILALGIGGLIALEATDPFPISPAKARELAYNYNKDLSEELDVPDAYEPFSTNRKPIEIDIGAVPLDGGLGLSLSGRF